MRIDLSLLTDGEAAQILRMPANRLLRLARQGEVPHVLLPDNEVRFDEADLAVWIREHKQGVNVSVI